jgi:cobalt-zinc-cadmium efflux system protein
MITLVLAAVYMVAEFVGGLISHSLALLADAGHMLSDVASLALSCFAVWLSDRPAGTQRTFGYYRAEILAALLNGAALIAVAIFILVEACKRLQDPPEVQGGLMMAIAVGGLIVNLAGLFILHGGRNENLNIRGAWLHVMSDTLGSVAVIVSGVLITLGGWHWVDPAISILISLLIVFSSWRLLADAAWVLMEGAPSRIDVNRVRLALNESPGVSDVHDLHIWTIASGLDSLSCHVVSDESQTHVDLLESLRSMVHQEFGIDHVTIQIEPAGFEERATPV